VATPHQTDIGRLLDDGEWGSRQKLFVFLTALTIVFDGVDNQLLGIAIPAMMRDWTLPRSAFAPILACGMIGMMAGGAIVSAAASPSSAACWSSVC
jgi:AAHS family 4-hydroxybenzoate transporter-like MFS transporter